MRIQIDIVCIFVFGGLAVLCLALSTLWGGFALIAGLMYLCASVTYTYRQYQKLKALQNQIAEDRYTDAYVYADENYADFDPKSFTYSRKEEKQITLSLRNRKGMLYVGVVQIVAAIVITVASILILIG